MKASMTKEEEDLLKKEVVNKMASNLTFSEIIDLVASLCVDEVNKQFEELTEEQKLDIYKDLFDKQV